MLFNSYLYYTEYTIKYCKIVTNLDLFNRLHTTQYIIIDIFHLRLAF